MWLRVSAVVLEYILCPPVFAIVDSERCQGRQAPIEKVLYTL